MTKSKIQKFIKTINSFFINIILFLFYFGIIGVIVILYRLFKKKTKETDSYWEDFTQNKFDLDYFKSAY